MRDDFDSIVPARYERRHNRFTRWLGRLLVHWSGWRIAGKLPDIPKVVVAVAPHTSNWDFVLGVMFLFALDVKIAFLGKHTLFKGLFGGFMRSIGGIPVDRSQPHGVVGECIAAIQAADRMLFALSPEGTRRLDKGFKTGFLHIAHGAGVPICLAYFDFANKTLGFGPLFNTTGDVTRDLEHIVAFYKPIKGRYWKTWQQ